MVDLKSKIQEEAMKRNYSKEEIKEIENEILNRDMKIGLESNALKNELELRLSAYNRMKGIVESKLEEGEEILVSKINVPYPAGTGWISIVVFYQGLFFTNKRAFLFGLNYKYEEVDGEKLKIFDLDDVKELIDKSEIDGMSIEFKHSGRIFVKSYSERERELTYIIAKMLLEKGVKVYEARF
ncbi:MAG: hypothetical protein ACRC2K_02600 [Clostridium sp.]